MIEAIAKAAGRDVSRETWDGLGHYVKLLTDESAAQNLVAASTLSSVWERHILDSAQLVALIPADTRSLVDVGSGAGLPGIVIGLLTDLRVTLVEPRRLRADFLRRTIATLELGDRVTVEAAKVESVQGIFDVITARALASLDRLLAITRHLSHAGTVWLLPKGRSAKSELVEAQRSWHCQATSNRSITDPQSDVLLLSQVRAKIRR